MNRPETNLPPLAGLGIHARRVDAVRPDGASVTFMDNDLRFIETRDGRFFAEAAGLDPIPLAADDVRSAAWGLPNLVAAAAHEARKSRRDDPVWERIAEMVAAGVRVLGRAS